MLLEKRIGKREYRTMMIEQGRTDGTSTVPMRRIRIPVIMPEDDKITEFLCSALSATKCTPSRRALVICSTRVLAGNSGISSREKNSRNLELSWSNTNPITSNHTGGLIWSGLNDTPDAMEESSELFRSRSIAPEDFRVSKQRRSFACVTYAG